MSGSMGVLIKTVLTMYDTLSSRSLDLMREKSLREQAEKNLEVSEERWKFVLESSGESIWDWDISNANYVELAFPTMKLFEDTEAKYGNDIHPADIETMKIDFSSHIAGETDFYINKHRRIRSDGSWSWVLSRGKVVSRNAEGTPTRMVGMHSDITERELASLIYHNSSQGMFVCDADNKIISINPAFTTITGYTIHDVASNPPKLLSSGRHGREFYKEMWATIEQEGQWQGEIWNKRKNGEEFAERLIINRVDGDDGSVDHYIALFLDITDQKIADEQIFRNAYYDQLTGLPNRALFSDRFNQAIARSRRTNHQLAICFIDLDNFKPINDTYGHEVGDRVLVETAHRLKKSLREEDTVSRLGGDEFVLLLSEIISLADAESRVERIAHELTQPFIIDGDSHLITSSIGMTIYPDDNADIDLLLRHADQAMYSAKMEGKNRYRLFNPLHHKESVSRQEQLERLREAIVRNELQLYYQPKVNMATGELYGVEGLIRWNHPEKGLIPPLQFLPLVDGTEQENQIGEWVINEALQQMVLWQQEGIELEVSVNISAHHLQSDKFLTTLESALSKHPTVSSNQLQLEILESTTLSNLDRITSIITSCKQVLGIEVALDDFGTGYSSLTHLRYLPARILKIDQSFVRDILDDSDDYSIIDGVIGLANSFNREVIAEGVESTAHGELLLIMGCEYAQGYGIAKPMPADEFSKWHSSYQPNQQWLGYANSELSLNEKSKKILQLTMERWYQLFITNLKTDHADLHHWPILDKRKCHCGFWVERIKQEGRQSRKFLSSLDATHLEMHTLANQLYELYTAGEIEAARNGIDALQKIFEKVNSSLS